MGAEHQPANGERRAGDGEGAGDTVLRGATLALLARIVGGVCTGVITVFLARRLGAGSYGSYALVLAIESLLFLASDFGVVQSAQRFMAARRDAAPRLAEVFGDALRLKVVGLTIVGVALYALSPVIARSYGTPALRWGLRTTAITLVGMNVLLLGVGLFTATRRQAYTLLAFSAESVAELLATVGAVLVFGGSVAALAGRAAGYLCGGAVAMVLVVRLVGSAGARRLHGGSGRLRAIALDAGALVIVDGAYTLFTQIDSLLIGAYLSVGAVGIWQAPNRLVALLVYPGQALASAVVPRLISTPGQPAEPEVFLGAIRLMVIVMCAVVAVTTVWAAEITRLALGASFAHSAPVLRAIAPYVFLSGTGQLVSVGMNYLGAARRRIPIAVSTATVNIIIDLILIPRIGVLGGAVGTDVAFAIYVPAHFLYCRRALGLPLRPILHALAGGLGAGASMAGVLFLCGTGRLGPGTILLGLGAGIPVFLAVLRLFGAVSSDELRDPRLLLRAKPARVAT